MWSPLRYASVKHALAQVRPGGRTLGTTLCGRRILTSVQSCDRLNGACLCLGLVSALGALGVSAFQVGAVFWMHMFSAGVFFVGGGVFVLGNLFLDFVVPSTSKRSRLARCVLLSALPVLLVTGVVLYFAIPMQENKSGKRHSSPTFVVAASVMEITCFIVFGLYLASYVPSMARVRLEVTIHVDPPAASGDNDDEKRGMSQLTESQSQHAELEPTTRA